MRNVLLLLIAIIVFHVSHAQWTTNGSSIYYNSGNVGVGISNPQQALEVAGKIRSTLNTSEYVDFYFQQSDITQTGYNDIWPDRYERAVMIKPSAYLDGWGAGGAGIQFYTYDVAGGTYPNYTGGYRRAMVIRKNGNVGIGTVNPNSTLTVNGDIGMLASGVQKYHLTYYNGGFNLAETGVADYRFFIKDGGNVGLGTNNPQAKLSVNGDILSKKVKVTQTGWSDYVFYPNYRLLSLKEVEDFIKLHKRLPDVPSEAEIQTNGLDLGSNQATLLKKIEELTLYIIDQDKKITEQTKQIEVQSKKVQEQDKKFMELQDMNKKLEEQSKTIEEQSKSIEDLTKQVEALRKLITSK